MFFVWKLYYMWASGAPPEKSKPKVVNFTFTLHKSSVRSQNQQQRMNKIFSAIKSFTKHPTMSNSAANESPTEEETKSPLLPSLSSLPDPVTLSCLARVSRSDHLAVSLVSKKHRSLVNSSDSELYKTRSHIGRTEECLYVCLSIKPDTTPRWFILRRRDTLETPDKRLIPIPSFLSQPPVFSSFVVLDWGIYVVGGFINDKRTSDVLLLDCRTNTWRHAPSMGVARVSAAAGVIGGKIYVFGGCEDLHCSNWAEVFNPVTQTWDALLPMPDRNESDNLFSETRVMKGKVYAETIFYSPSEAVWGRLNKPETQSYRCVIENMLYGCDSFGNLVWRESEELEWKEVKGLEGLRMNFPRRASVRTSAFEKRVRKLSNFGVNMVLIWVGPMWDVWCAEISLERREEDGKVWGKIEWSEAVTTLATFPLVVWRLRFCTLLLSMSKLMNGGEGYFLDPSLCIFCFCLCLIMMFLYSVSVNVIR